MMGFEPTVSNSTSYCITFLLHLLYSLFLSHLFFLFSRLLPIRPSFFPPSRRGFVGGSSGVRRGMAFSFSLSSFPFSSPDDVSSLPRGSSRWLFLVLFLPFPLRSFSRVLPSFFLLRFFFLSISHTFYRRHSSLSSLSS